MKVSGKSFCLTGHRQNRKLNRRIQRLEGQGLTVNTLPKRHSLLEHLADVRNHRCLVGGDSLLIMEDDVSGVTVLIATYNRAAMLSQTLEAFTSIGQTGIDCSIVIIDNNSSDNTAEVVKEYETRLPVSYLREPRPGKSCALNKALRECALKEIVVFTDDDVTTARNWCHDYAGYLRLLLIWLVLCQLGFGRTKAMVFKQ